jgi:hypothetical protein
MKEKVDWYINCDAESGLMGKRNLVHDTVHGRARRGLAQTIHRVDDALYRIGSRGRRRILFEAASPLSFVVFRPVYERLRRDDRIDFWFTTADTFWTADRIFGGAGVRGHVASALKIRWKKFDAYINADFTNMTWLPRRTRRIHLFHGVAGKYALDAPVRIAPLVAAFDRLLFPNADRMERYVQAGLIAQDSGQGLVVGYPKVDCLVDGSLSPRAIRESLGLDPRRPTVLYAPTWSPQSSLTMGEEVIRALGRMRVNVIVKLHDRSYDRSTRASGGIDWRARLQLFEPNQHLHVVEDPDVSPYMAVADALVTDHSSVGFEFMLLDRPIVVIDCPALIERALVSAEKAALLRSAAEVVERPEELPSAVARALQEGTRHSGRRRSIAAQLFYRPGGAAARATQCIYDLLALPAPESEPPAAAVSLQPRAVAPLQNGGSLKCAS